MKLLARVKMAQPQVCYPDPKQDMLDSKSSMCRKISNVAKTILGVNITWNDLFESIGSLSAPQPPKNHLHLRALKLTPPPNPSHTKIHFI